MAHFSKTLSGTTKALGTDKVRIVSAGLRDQRPTGPLGSVQFVARDRALCIAAIELEQLLPIRRAILQHPLAWRAPLVMLRDHDAADNSAQNRPSYPE